MVAKLVIMYAGSSRMILGRASTVKACGNCSKVGWGCELMEKVKMGTGRAVTVIALVHQYSSIMTTRWYAEILHYLTP